MAKYPNIEAERARAGLTVGQFANILGVTRKTVYNWAAKGDIPQSKVKEMATLFNCSADYLLGVKTQQGKEAQHE